MTVAYHKSVHWLDILTSKGGFCKGVFGCPAPSFIQLRAYNYNQQQTILFGNNSENGQLHWAEKKFLKINYKLSCLDPQNTSNDPASRSTLFTKTKPSQDLSTQNDTVLRVDRTYFENMVTFQQYFRNVPGHQWLEKKLFDIHLFWIWTGSAFEIMFA